MSEDNKKFVAIILTDKIEVTDASEAFNNDSVTQVTFTDAHGNCADIFLKNEHLIQLIKKLGF